MDGSYPSKLRVWEGSATAFVPVAATGLSPAAGTAVPLPPNPSEFARHLYTCEALAVPNGSCPDEVLEPYTLQWFLDIESQRHGRQGRWLPRLLEFAKHSGETLLGLGNGLGTDWLQYARHGAAVTVCSPSASQLALIRRNFELRGLNCRLLHSPMQALPLESASIDVVCLDSSQQDVANPAAVIEEVYRVLKPGGKVLAVTPAKYDVAYWHRCCFFWQRWWKGRPPAGPLGYSARGLRRLFGRFIEHRIHKRQLRRSEVPHLWRWVPLPLLERLMGRFLVLKAFKPLRAAMSLQAAA
jgi:ubiquinone/menaquinone biosynthesis C-methylase UbiE